VPLLFSSAAFLGAFLLFCLQPMIAKMMLPPFGGAPSVWNTCMVFFQATLLAAYGYAHAASGRMVARRQALMHLGLLALPAAVLPIAVPFSAIGGGYPALRLLGQLLAVAGLPFFVVATTAPLLQKWFAALGHPRSGDPYFLYAASNAGSLMGLVGYVTLIEPNLSLGGQARLWSAGYGLLVGLILACVVSLRRAPIPATGPESDPPVGLGERSLWVALAFAPSSLMLGVTTHLTTDLAPVPLLWVIPLTLYLLSFILAFAEPPTWVRRGVAIALPPAIVLTLALTAWLRVRPLSVPHWAIFLSHLATFFLAALGCHAELARRRPVAGRLTAFYLMVAIGGTLGGLFNALVAPLIFTWPAEYPLGLAMAALLVSAAGRPDGSRRALGRFARPLDIVLPMLLSGGAYLVLRHWGDIKGTRPPVFLWLAPLAACLLFVRRPPRFAIGLASVAVVVTIAHDADRNVVLRERDFFGVLRVMANYPPGRNTLVHGNVLHGMQRRSEEPSRRVVPLLYYSTSGPIGQVFRAYDGTPVTQRVGVIGLGVGSLAAYGKPGRDFTFFEIDPAVERIARDPAYFHHLQDCAARWRIVLGDARLSMGREPDGKFGLIVLDAFSGDSIPVHLLTREALRLYLAKLADGGLIALHVSNDYLDLEPAVGALARDAGLAGLDRNEDLLQIPPGEFIQGRMPAHWIVLARRQSDLDRLAARPGWRPLTARREVPVWTDDYSDLFRLLRWR
jgi:hypothetical protein